MPKKRNNTTVTREMKVERTFRAAPELRPKNRLQEQYMRCIDASPITVATGFAGTGKTYIPARMAAGWLKDGSIRSINLRITSYNVCYTKLLCFTVGLETDAGKGTLANNKTRIHVVFSYNFV